MPVIVQSHESHPFLSSLGGVTAIEAERALKQDIRPLKIVILNLMADKQTTERQLAHWLGGSALQIDLIFACTDSYFDRLAGGHEPSHTPLEHIRKFYCPWRDIKDQKFDGLILTGVNALEDRVEKEKNWPEVAEILAWSQTNVFSSLFLCWGAKAALKYFHNIDSVKGQKKIQGLYEHRRKSDTAGLLFGFPDRFSIPVARWKSPDRAAIESCAKIEILADCKETGPNILAETKAYDDGRHLAIHRAYILGHPEYETDTLDKEFKRDRLTYPQAPLPVGYYVNGDIGAPVVNTWRHTGLIYTNWIHLTYPATPVDLEQIPLTYDAARRE